MGDDEKIVQAFLQGQVKGLEEEGRLPEHIETQISHLFLFPETVYKVCKRDNVYFNEHFRNVADEKTRFQFYKDDFFENSYFSPDVYLGLYGLRVRDGVVERTNDIDSADDLVMKMKRIDPKYNLTRLLHERSLTQEDLRSMGYQQTKAVALYPHQPKTDEIYDQIMRRRLDDLRDWMGSAPDHFSKQETNEVMEALFSYFEKHRDAFIRFNIKDYVTSLDNHSDNIFYEKGKMFFLDIYPPKEDWKTVSPWTNIYRPATDILILMGEEYARAFIQGYKDHYGSLDESHELFYFIYSAAIQAVSLFNLSSGDSLKSEDSKVYKKYILEKIKDL